MFEDLNGDVLGFSSSPEGERLVSSKIEQTGALTTSNEKSQTSEVQDVGTQTIPQDTWTLVCSTTPYDVDKLAAFLNKILPKLEEELEDSVCGGGASCGVDQEGSIWEKGLESGFEKPTGVILNQISFQDDILQSKIVSDIGWNCNGNVLAIGFSMRVHEGWCNHESSIRVYNMNQTKFDKAPAMQIFGTSSCVRSIKFHPFIPTVMASAFSSGEILIWNLASEDEILFCREKGSDNLEYHSDAVKWLVWKGDGNGAKLVSGGRDGKIIFWKVTVGNLTFRPDERFAILQSDTMKLPTSVNECLEINSISFWDGNATEFIVAAGPKVIHCSSKSTNLITWLPDHRDPLVMNYKSHQGLATCTSCLPQSHLFASSGIDGKIHINKSKMSAPLYVINSGQAVMGLDWSNETRLTSWQSFSTIKCYKLSNKNISLISTAVHEVEDEITAFAQGRTGKLAVGKTTAVQILNDFNL